MREEVSVLHPAHGWREMEFPGEVAKSRAGPEKIQVILFWQVTKEESTQTEKLKDNMAG